MRLIHIDIEGDDGGSVTQHADEQRMKLDAVLGQHQHAVVRRDARIGQEVPPVHR